MVEHRRPGHRLLSTLGVLALGGLVLVVLAALVVTVGPRLQPEAAAPPEECSEVDPTAPDSEQACLTPTAARLHAATVARFGEPGGDAPIRSATCFSEHAWNPASDHPAGRACDFFPTGYGEFPEGDELRAGWEVARWLTDNASELGVRYVIWQGRIWTARSGLSDALGLDGDTWGRPYDGGGVYDPEDATGGHFDHIHVSVRR